MQTKLGSYKSGRITSVIRLVFLIRRPRRTRRVYWYLFIYVSLERIGLIQLLKNAERVLSTFKQGSSFHECKIRRIPSSVKAKQSNE